MDIKPIYLVKVDGGANSNKFYRMIPNGTSFTVEFGRVGGGAQSATYSLSQWNAKYNEKLRKGYVDRSSLVDDLVAVVKTTSGYKPIGNSSIATIVERLQAMANKAIADNYTVSSNAVTSAMVERAQVVLGSLVIIDNIDEFNMVLLELFGVIPRKMGDVKKYMASDRSDFGKIIEREQDLLDVMRGQVVKPAENVTSGEDEQPEGIEHDATILDAQGLVFNETTEEEKRTIRAMLGSASNRFHDAWAVSNNRTQRAFDEFVFAEHGLRTKMLWHGSRNENWWSIINAGLMLKPTNAIITGKMFGNGIYFAPSASKSLGYTSLEGSYWAKGNARTGFMALYDVAYGIPHDVHSFSNSFYGFDYGKLKKTNPNAHCVHAHAGSMLRNDEIIVYQECQTTVKFLVELRS